MPKFLYIFLLVGCVSANSVCRAQILENFDAAVTGWSFSGAAVSSNQPCSGTKSILFIGTGQYAITPAINNPGTLNFNKKRSSDATAWSVQVQVSNASPASQTSGPWTTVATVTSIAQTCGANPAIDLSAYTGLRYVRFIDNRASGANERAIDDVWITTSCTQPTTQASFTSVTSITSNSMTINVGSGNGAGRIVAIYTSAISSTPTGSYATATSVYSSTPATLSGGEKVVYAGTGNTVTVTGLAINTMYYIKVFEYSASFCYNTGGTGSTGSATTACNTPTVSTSGIIVSGVTSSSASLNWTNGNGTNRLIVLNASSPVSGAPVNGQTYTANASYSLAPAFTPGTGKIIYNGSATIMGISGLTNNTLYYGAIFEFDNTSKCYQSTGVTFSFNTLSAQTDIVSANGEAACISSILNGNITTVADGTQVWQFSIRDGGVSLSDADALPSIINQLVISQGVSNGVADWTNIQSAALFDGSTLLANGTITATTLTFSGSPLVSVADNASKTISLRITLKAALTIPTTADGKVFRFSITNANITTAPSGTSGKNTSALVATTNVLLNPICVVASKLAVSTQPSTTGVNLTMAAVVFKAYDVNNNTDLDFNQTVSITSTGTMTGAPLTVNAISGTATFPSIKHSVIGTGYTLTATSSGVSAVVSGTFDITVNNNFAPGDFAILAVNTNISSGDDEITFVVFKPVVTGTQFYMTDCGYEHTSAGKWGTTEGVIRLAYAGSTIAAGTILTVQGSGGNNATITVRDCNNAAAAGWTITKSIGGTGSFDLNASDQVWFTQGGTWTNGGANNLSYTGGSVLYGWSGLAWKTAPGYASTQGSTIYPNTVCFTTLLSGTLAFKYTGIITAATRLGWISRINTPANWTNYTTTALYNAAARNYKNGTVCAITINVASEQDGLWTGTKSTDWFDCNNWDTRQVPDATTNVLINATATNNCTVDQTSSFTVWTGTSANCRDLIVDTRSLSTAAAADVINVYGNFTLRNAATLNMTNGGTFSLFNGSWTNTASTFTSGTGTVVYGASLSQTIAPENYNNLTSSSTGDRDLSTTGTIGIKSVFTPGTNIYTVASSHVNFNGTGAQNIPGLTTLSGSPYTNQYNQLTLSGSGIKTTTASFTILDRLKISTGTTFTIGAGLTTTIKSDPTKTASVDQVDGAISYGAGGKFMIERALPMNYNSSSRRWRLLTAPLTSTNAPTINAAWQEGATSTDRLNPVDPNPGYGTSITNGVVSANGYDQGSTGNPSLFRFNAGAWVAPAATNSGTIADEQGYMIFARGDRSLIVANQYVNASPTILRAAGQIKTGTITVPLTGVGTVVVGNPYPSRIKMDNVTFNGVAGKNSTYYLWDPKTSGAIYNVGKFITCSGNGDGTYLVTANASGLPTDGTIESGMAFMVNAGAGNAVFTESNKITGSSTVGIASARPVRNLAMGLLSIELYGSNASGRQLNGGVITAFHRSFNNAVDAADAPALTSFNTKECITLARQQQQLSIERRQPIALNDTIFIQLNKLNVGRYEMHIIPQQLDTALIGILEDGFTGTRTPIRLNEDYWHGFNISTDPASTLPNRFRIVFIKRKLVHGEGIVFGNGKTDNNRFSLLNNPVNDQVIRWKTTITKAGKCVFVLTNALGETVATTSVTLATGANSGNWNLSNHHLTSGIYQWIIQSNDHSESISVIVP